MVLHISIKIILVFSKPFTRGAILKSTLFQPLGQLYLYCALLPLLQDLDEEQSYSQDRVDDLKEWEVDDEDKDEDEDKTFPDINPCQ